jgi:hypothetical protein
MEWVDMSPDGIEWDQHNVQGVNRIEGSVSIFFIFRSSIKVSIADICSFESTVADD